MTFHRACPTVAPVTGKITVLLTLLLGVMTGVSSIRAAEPRADIINDLAQWPMYANPEIRRPAKKIVHVPELLPLWIAALKASESDLQRQAADTVTRAVEDAVPGIEDMAPGLVALVAADDTHPLVLRSASSALFALNHKPAADLLLKLAERGQLPLCQVIEPGLAEWALPAAIELWHERIQSERGSRQLVRLAILCLRQVQDKASLPRLVELVLDTSQPLQLRIEAARSVAVLADEPATAAAQTIRTRRWDGPAGWLNRYLAAWLLSPNGTPTAEGRGLLQLLAKDPDGSIAAVALDALLTSDPQAALEIAGSQRDHRDGHVRYLAARAIHQQLDQNNVAALVAFLDDSYRPLRLQVREWLLELLKEEQFASEVAGQLVQLQVDLRWYGIEQLLRIMVAVPDLADPKWIIALVEHERPEVFVTAAWAARRLKVAAALPVLHSRLVASMRQISENNESVVPASQQDDLVEQMCHALQAFGEMGFHDGEAVMFRLVRKNPVYPFRLRGAATWGIGLLAEGEPHKTVPAGRRAAQEADLAAELRARVADEAPIPPEGVIVKRMAAISLARMKSSESLPLLEQYFLSSPLDSALKWTTAWAIQDLGGDKIDVPGSFEVESQGWFLEPAGGSAGN